MTKIDPVTLLFSEEGSSPEIDTLTMGYDDLSGGEAFALLQLLPVRSVDAILHFTHDGPFDSIGQVSHALGLVQGLDERDPVRNSQTALEIAKKEVDMSRAFLEMLRDCERLPVIGRLHQPGDLGPDAVKVGWGVTDVSSEDRADAETYLPTLDTVDRYLEDPIANADTYREAVLTFMNDVIFRPNVTFDRH